MRIRTTADGLTFSMDFEPGTGDEVDGPKAALGRTVMSAQLSGNWTYESLHPDLVALVAVLSVAPWATSGIQMDRGVSRSFALAVGRGLGIEVAPIDPSLEARVPPSHGRPGLAFSGGVDSMAAVAVMPENTVLYFNERLDPEGTRQTRYNKSAAVLACDTLAEAGRVVRRVPCDVEHLRVPVGVPVDYSNAIPAVLMADADGLDSIGWGTIAESAYNIGRSGYVDYAGRSGFYAWRDVFAAAGLAFFNSVAGISEVGTSEIVRSYEHGSLAQSCIRGTPGKPCETCWKCVRKSLLDSALSGEWPSHEWVAKSMAQREPMRFLSQRPIKHESVLTYAMARYDGDLEELRLLRKRVRADSMDVGWLKKHYPPALDLVPEKYRHQVRQAIEHFLPAMTDAEQEAFRTWTTEPVVEDEQFESLTLAFKYSVQFAKVQADINSFTRRLASAEIALKNQNALISSLQAQSPGGQPKGDRGIKRTAAWKWARRKRGQMTALMRGN